MSNTTFNELWDWVVNHEEPKIDKEQLKERLSSILATPSKELKSAEDVAANLVDFILDRNNANSSDTNKTKAIVSGMIKDLIAASQLHPSPTHDVEDGKQVIELLVRCKHALGILSTICGVADLPEGKEVANKILKDIIAYFPKGNIEDCLRSNDANGANMMQSEIDKIKELIKPWQQMEKNIDDYACAKNERQKEKAMVRGIEIRRSMETNLKELVKILYERTPAIQ